MDEKEARIIKSFSIILIALVSFFVYSYNLQSKEIQSLKLKIQWLEADLSDTERLLVNLLEHITGDNESLPKLASMTFQQIGWGSNYSVYRYGNFHVSYNENIERLSIYRTYSNDNSVTYQMFQIHNITKQKPLATSWTWYVP